MLTRGCSSPIPLIWLEPLHSMLQYARLGWSTSTMSRYDVGINCSKSRNLEEPFLYTCTGIQHNPLPSLPTQLYSTMFYLLDQGADPNMPMPSPVSCCNSSALIYMAFMGRADLVHRMLKANGSVTFKNDQGQTPLHAIAECPFR